MQQIILSILFSLSLSIGVYGQEPGRQGVFGASDSTEKSIEGESERDIIYPNPTYGKVNFDLTSYYNDTQKSPYFKIVISNIIAKEIFSVVFKSQLFIEDFGFLDKGSYLLSVENEQGKKLFARRLVIVSP